MLAACMNYVLTSSISLLTAPTDILVSSQADVEVSGNQTILLTCIALSLPSPTFTWTRNNHPVTMYSSAESSTLIASEEIVRSGVVMVKSTLSMCNLPRFASGIYSCVATNGITTSNSSFSVNREGKAKSSQIIRHACM